LESFLGETAALGQKLGPLLVQLPPSLRYDPGLVKGFFNALRERFSGGVVCEPRHPSWFTPEAGDLLSSYQAARAAADPATPPGCQTRRLDDLVYYRTATGIYYPPIPETINRIALARQPARGET
jgi:uncharacterized protein YecE (DUF72 family)